MSARWSSGERVLAGFGLGLVAYIWIVNWIGRFLPPFWAFLGGAVIVFLLGVLSAFPFRGPWLDLNDLRIGPWIAAGILLFWVFLRISKGTGLFDETSNLATISTLANGQIPVRAYFGEASLHRYHYAIHFLGAGMMQLGRFTPWSAFDLSKSIVWSLVTAARWAGRKALPAHSLWLGSDGRRMGARRRQPLADAAASVPPA